MGLVQASTAKAQLVSLTVPAARHLAHTMSVPMRHDRWLPALFTPSAAVAEAAAAPLGYVTLLQPLNALVFVLDGVLVGACDFAFLAAVRPLPAHPLHLPSSLLRRALRLSKASSTRREACGTA
jgi:hypothetical protein